MERKRTEWLTRKLDGARAEEVSAFASGLRETIRDPARATARLAWDRSDKRTWLASDVAGRLRDQAVVPTLEVAPSADPKSRQAPLLWAVTQEVALRKKVLAQVDQLLSDKSPLPQGPHGAGAAPRVCDAGYVLLQRLLVPHAQQGEAAFYALSEAERDTLIALARSKAGG